MDTGSPSRLSDGTLRRALLALVTQDHLHTAQLLLHLAEFDARGLHREDGYPSLFAYCVQVLHFSEDEAFKRIRAARAARRFPAVLEALAQGQLHLTAVVLLAPHLGPENAEELLAEARHHTKAEIELLLARRFPRPDLAPSLRPLARPALPVQVVPEPVAPVPKSTPEQGQQ